MTRPRHKNTAPVEEHYSPEQVADKLAVDVSTVYRLIRKQQLSPVRKLSRKMVRVPASALNAYLEGRTVVKKPARLFFGGLR